MNGKSIKEIIHSRYSVRNYNGELLSNEIIEKIETYIKDLSNPFDKEVKIKLVNKHKDNEDIKLGTYGVIRGAENFLISACNNDDLSLMTLGYSLEKVILYCTSLGLGTVWLGGTFKKSDFAKAINLQDDEILPIVSPVGVEGGKKSLFASIASKSRNKRKDFSDVFFNENFNTPLTENDAKEFFEPLEMLRLAPSAVNKQPWRVIKTGNRIDFYVATNNSFSNVDIGIALCHFHLTALENNLKGEFKVNNPKNEDTKFNYVISWIS